MPILSAAGGAASKGFGQFAPQGGGGYDYYLWFNIGSSNTYQEFYGASGATLSAATGADLVATSTTRPGYFNSTNADYGYWGRGFSAMTDTYVLPSTFSVDGGSNWVNWPPVWLGNGGGPFQSGTQWSSSGSTFISPDKSKILVFAEPYDSKTNRHTPTFYSFDAATGTNLQTRAGAYYSAGSQPIFAYYSSVYDKYYCFNGTGSGRIYASDLSSVSSTNMPAYPSYTCGVKDGLLWMVSASGYAYYQSSYDLNMVQAGSSNASQSWPAPAFWLPINNKWMTIRGSTSDTPQIGTSTDFLSWSYSSLGSFTGINVPGRVFKPVIFEDSNGYIYLSAEFGYINPKSQYYWYGRTVYSTDGGSSWTLLNLGGNYGFTAVVPNFSNV